MDDYNLKRIADALEEIAKEFKYRREIQFQETNQMGGRVEKLVEEVSLIKQYISKKK